MKYLIFFCSFFLFSMNSFSKETYTLPSQLKTLAQRLEKKAVHESSRAPASIPNSKKEFNTQLKQDFTPIEFPKTSQVTYWNWKK